MQLMSGSLRSFSYTPTFDGGFVRKELTPQMCYSISEAFPLLEKLEISVSLYVINI